VVFLHRQGSQAVTLCARSAMRERMVLPSRLARRQPLRHRPTRTRLVQDQDNAQMYLQWGERGYRTAVLRLQRRGCGEGAVDLWNGDADRVARGYRHGGVGVYPEYV
jgi:hypothetical protein